MVDKSIKTSTRKEDTSNRTGREEEITNIAVPERFGERVRGSSSSEEVNLETPYASDFGQGEELKRLDMNDVDPKMYEFLMEGIELDKSIEKLEGSIKNRIYMGDRRRSSSCSSYGYIPIKNLRRFQD